MESFHEEDLPLLQSGEKAGCGISAVMPPELRAAVERLSEPEWKTINEETDAVRQWAEVAFCPDDGDHRQEGPVARRYLAIRIKKKQGVLFADGSDRKHFAVVTNLDWAGDTILDWQRKKAGTVEHVHDVMKNGLTRRILDGQTEEIAFRAPQHCRKSDSPRRQDHALANNRGHTGIVRRFKAENPASRSRLAGD